jgi:hypothetical protein
MGCELLWSAATILACLTATGALAQDRAPTPGLVLYVSPAGNDSWSGKLDGPNHTATDGPFATLEGARNAIRALKRAGGLPPGGVEVVVRGGAYELTSSFKLTAEDAGTKDAPIVWRAQPGEKAILTGARQVTGFVPDRGKIVKADVGAQGFRGIYFRQLLLDGSRQVLARYPNFDAANPHGGGFAYVDGVPISMYKDLPQEELRVIHCKAKDVRRWARPELGEVIIFPRYNWINMSVPVASADAAAGTITLGKDVKWGNFQGIRPMDRYYVRNLPEELDAPGEWYLDRDTWTLYFWPPKDLADSVVRAPVTEHIVEIGPNADWVTLRGFDIQGCDGSAIWLHDSENCLIAGNTIHDTGGRLDYNCGVSVRGGHNCGVVGNDICEVANGAIRLESAGADRDNLIPTGHYADNNYIHHIGVLNGHGCGIYLSGVALRASHNLIHDITRCGIFGGGPDCVVEYNHIRHVNLETEDTGGYYNGAAWHVRGQIVRYNYIHDVLGYGRTGDRWTSPHFAWGIYLDDDLSGVHVYGNIVARTTLGGAHIHAGRDNTIENNIFIEGANQQMQYSGHDPRSWVVTMHLEEFKKAMAKPAWQAKYPELAAADLETIWLMAGNKFVRNIVYYRKPTARLYAYSRNDVPEQNQSDYNLIWHFGLPLDVGLPGVPADKQWGEWRKRGFDTHSVVADPLFVDPEKDDYRLQPDSPAYALGFKDIPVADIGPYASDLRASWPIVEAPGVRETPLVETRVELPAGATPPVRVPPQASVPKVAAPPVIDGTISAGEWPGAALTVAQEPDGTPVTNGPCELRLAHDGANLYVAVTVLGVDAARLKLGTAWGEDDAAEVCFRDASGAQPGPTFVVHGFAAGSHESVTEAGAPADATRRVGEAVRFAARTAGDRWTAEWQIPLIAAGIGEGSGRKLGLNVGVRRTQTGQWVQWFGSGSTWSLDRAGSVTLE